MAKLRPRARIVRTIGDQLISGPEAALIELVKNSFDADSPYSHIKISPKIDGKNSIVVSDNGHGMSSDDLINKWLEPATSDKLERKISPGERIMLGAKGVGRFATARLGSSLTLQSVKRVSNNQLEASELNVDWEEFERATYLDEIDIDISNKKIHSEKNTGVKLEIKNLRDSWTKRQLEMLIRELKRLASPLNSRENNFQIFLDLTDFNQKSHGFNGQELVSGLQLSGEKQSENPFEIKPFSIDKIFHYMVEGEFDENGRFLGVYINQRGENKKQLIEVPATELSADEKNCGNVSLRLNIYDREGDAVLELFEKLGLGSIGRRDAKKVLDENIGIGIYRTGFRIRPYGDAETDWLELERMRVQNPSKKLGLYQVWGMVEILDEGKSGLIERSSREGLEHNGEFNRLKRIISELLNHIEALRQDFRQGAGLSRKTAADTDQVRNKANLSAITQAASSLPPKYRSKIQRAIQKDSLELKTSIAELETYQQALASHSTLGLVVAQVLHDGRRFLSDISTRSKRIKDSAPRLLEDSNFGAHFRKTFEKESSSIYSSTTQISKLFKSLDPISGKRRGKPSLFNVESIIERCTELFSDSLRESSIEIITPKNFSNAKAMGHESDLMAALINIIDNAIHWLSTSIEEKRIIEFVIEQPAEYIKISISNNGPLIPEHFHHRLFTPSFTLKSEGSGIGLAIAREAMRASKGDIAFDPQHELTTFVIEMRRA